MANNNLNSSKTKIIKILAINLSYYLFHKVSLVAIRTIAFEEMLRPSKELIFHSI